MSEYFTFSPDEQAELRRILEEGEEGLSPYAARDSQAVRPAASHYAGGDPVRGQYIVDVDKIIHCAQFNRGTDKTQVFSFYRNDDITRRSSHVQLVSRIARTIGRALRLNLDLIEAIAVGHDIGHTPFGHKGEDFLSALYHGQTGRYFLHNVHSVRILKDLLRCNLTLQTLDGILCHCGERVETNYAPAPLGDFDDFAAVVERCYREEDYTKSLRPATLEGCVVRISDIIAYVGKDRQDAWRVGLRDSLRFDGTILGSRNWEIIPKVTANLLKNSMGRPYLQLDREVYQALDKLRRDNNELIYQIDDVNGPYFEAVRPMMEKLYFRLLEDIRRDNRSSPIFLHHMDDQILGRSYVDRDTGERIADPNDIVMDYIASMTDDYFVDLFDVLFPGDPLADKITYIGYFAPR